MSSHSSDEAAQADLKINWEDARNWDIVFHNNMDIFHQKDSNS